MLSQCSERGRRQHLLEVCWKAKGAKSRAGQRLGREPAMELSAASRRTARLRGSSRSTAACSSSVSSLSDRLSSPANVDKVAARSRESTWHKNLNQDTHTHVWHNRAHASKRYDKDHAGTFIGRPLPAGLAGRILSLRGRAMVWYWTLTEDNVQRMQVPLFIQRMQVTVLRRWRGDGMICHVPKN